MKTLSILLVLAVPLATSDGFQSSTSSDIIWPPLSTEQPDINHRIEPNFHESEFSESLENRILVTILIRKDGTVEDVIPAIGSSDERIINKLCETIKKWKFNPSESNQTAVFSFTVTIETKEPTSR